jgi:hypothetical protein
MLPLSIAQILPENSTFQNQGLSQNQPEIVPSTLRITYLAALVPALLAAPMAQAQLSFSTNADGLTATITGYSGSGTVLIPGTTNNLKVTVIAASAFENKFGITSVSIPTNVTIIGNYAFLNCWYMTNVTIAGTVAGIGISAFENCQALPSFPSPKMSPTSVPRRSLAARP